MSGHPCVFLLGLLTTAAAAQLSNHTIDDEYGDSVTGALPEYFNHWVQGAECNRCGISLNTAKLFRGTWHGTATSLDAESIPNITLRFTGVAIYVFNVLANRVPSVDFSTDTRLTFILDGAVDGHFQHEATSSMDFVFNHLVYAHSDLANGDHVLVIQPDAGSLCMFDYAEYTFANQSTISSTSTPPPSSPTSHPLSSSSTCCPSSTFLSISSPTFGLGAPSSSSATSPSATPYPTSQGSSKTDVSPPMSSQQQAVAQTSGHLGAVVGGSIGGVAIFLLLLLALWVYLRTKRRTVWSWLPPYEGTGTESRHTRTFSSRELLEGILHITSPRPRPSENAFHRSSAPITLPPTEGDDHETEVARDNGPSLPSLFSDQLVSFRGLPASVEGPCQETEVSPHTSVEVVVDGKLQLSDVGRRFGCPASTRSDTARRSFSQMSMTRSLDTTVNEEVLSQLASLRAEVAGLRAQQEAQQRLMEAPPRYGEGM